jgi:hypothetical protein
LEVTKAPAVVGRFARGWKGGTDRHSDYDRNVVRAAEMDIRIRRRQDAGGGAPWQGRAAVENVVVNVAVAAGGREAFTCAARQEEDIKVGAQS